MRTFLASLVAVALLASCASRPKPLPSGPVVAVLAVRVKGEKTDQRVVIDLFEGDAPLTVANFKQLVQEGYYDGMRFHRVFPASFVQTGDPYSRHGDNERSGTGGPGYTVPAEIKRNHVTGSVATSRLEDDVNPTRASNGSQFYVCLEPMPQLDGEYTVFGEVIEGLDVLKFVSGQKTDSNDFPLEKIVIQSIHLEPRVAPAASGSANPGL